MTADRTTAALRVLWAALLAFRDQRKIELTRPLLEAFPLFTRLRRVLAPALREPLPHLAPLEVFDALDEVLRAVDRLPVPPTSDRIEWWNVRVSCANDWRELNEILSPMLHAGAMAAAQEETP